MYDHFERREIEDGKSVYVGKWVEAVLDPDASEAYVRLRPNVSIPDPLEASIEKWSLVVRCLQGRVKYIDDGGADSCALCVVYQIAKDEGDCTGCPVKRKTGLPYCRGTPYDVWDVDNKETLPVAEKEVAFLESLREEMKEI